MRKISIGLLIIFCCLSLSALACGDDDDTYQPTVTIEVAPADPECWEVCDFEICWVECP